MNSQTGSQTSSQSLQELFTHKTIFPEGKSKIYIWVMWSVVAFIYGLPTGNPFGVIILLLISGSITGLIWRKIGWGLTYRSYIIPLRKMRENPENFDVTSRFLKLYLGKDLQDVFLQFETPDTDISTPKLLFMRSRRILISFIAITLTAARFLITLYDDPTSEELGIVIVIGFFIAFPALAIYIPQALITEDARIMVVHKDGSIRYAGSKLRDGLEGIFGITGIISGFDLFTRETGISIGSIFTYIGFIIIITILSAPVLFPALIFYYRVHSDFVNKFREEAVKAKIYPARTTAEPLTSEELQLLTLGDLRPSHEIQEKTLFGKLRKVVKGPRFKSDTLTSDEINNLEEKGAWICGKCNYINPTIKFSFCQQCGQKIK